MILVLWRLQTMVLVLWRLQTMVLVLWRFEAFIVTDGGFSFCGFAGYRRWFWGCDTTGDDFVDPYPFLSSLLPPMRWTWLTSENLTCYFLSSVFCGKIDFISWWNHSVLYVYFNYNKLSILATFFVQRINEGGNHMFLVLLLLHSS
jgi:hypothetical protein